MTDKAFLDLRNVKQCEITQCTNFAVIQLDNTQVVISNDMTTQILSQLTEIVGCGVSKDVEIEQRATA